MLRSEAVWLGKQIYSLNSKDVFPLLNIGSSTKDFREKTQPWIDTHIFKLAREKEYPVIHMDIKKEEGVDIVGDLSDQSFLQEVADLKIKSVMCSNLLEHVINREEICQIISSLIPKGGYLFVSGPYNYPYHADPIDTMYRPNIDELQSAFPGFQKIEAEIVYSHSNSTRFPFFIFASWITLRLLLPLYKPQQWRYIVKRFPFLFRKVSATCLVLQKN